MKLPPRYEWSSWVFVILLSALGVVIIRVGDDLWRPVGEALLIAAALALTVDRYIKLRLRDELAKDVFFATLGIDLPKEIKEEMLAIGEYKLVRRDMHINYTLRPHTQQHLVTCTIAIEFDMQNLTSIAQPFTHQLSIADAPAGALNATQPILSVKGGPRDAPYYSWGAETIKLTESVHGRDWQHTVNIPAKGVHHFASTTQHILPIEFEDPTIFVEPTVVVTVSVDATPGVSDHVIFDHRLSATAHPLANNAWRIDAAFLPNTLVRTVWEKAATPKKTQAMQEVRAGGAQSAINKAG